MLIVRLYDGDVSERERADATALVAACGECAQLLADLGAIAAVTRAMPAPPRPRDFLLTEADAVRLGRPDGTPVAAPGRLAWTNLRRSFGGALAALGLAGILLASATTFLMPSHSARFSQAATSGDSNGVVAPQAPAPAAAASPGSLAMATAAPAQPAPATAAPTPATAATPTPATVSVAGTADQTPRTAASSATDVSAPSPAPAATGAAASPAAQLGSKTVSTPPTPTNGPLPGGGQIVVAGPSDGYAYDNGTDGTTESAGGPPIVPSATGSNPASFDAGTLAFLGSGLALVLGLGLLAGPTLLRRGRRTR